jgi:hypothetical protein
MSEIVTSIEMRHNEKTALSKYKIAPSDDELRLGKVFFRTCTEVYFEGMITY